MSARQVRVLVIDDAESVCRMYLRAEIPDLVVAKDHGEANERIDEGGWDIVLMDGSLDLEEGHYDTKGLVIRLRESGHTGLIIANSGRYNRLLMYAGCDRESPNDEKLSVENLRAIIAELSKE